MWQEVPLSLGEDISSLGVEILSHLPLFGSGLFSEPHFLIYKL